MEKDNNIQPTGIASMEEREEEQHLDEFDDEPAFLDPGEAVEVAVDDEDVPMEEEDDDEVEGDANDTIDQSNAQFQIHTGPVYGIAGYLDDDQENASLVIISGGGDDKACLHTRNGSKILEHNFKDTVSSVAVHVSNDPSTRLMVAGSYDGTMVVFDLNSNNMGQKLKEFEGPTDVEWVAFHPTGSVLLCGSTDGTVWMFHIGLSKCLQVFVGHEDAVAAGTFANDGKLAVTTSADGTVRVWAPKTGQAKHVFRFQAPLTCLTVNPNDSKLILVGSEDGQAHVCHIVTHKVLASFRHSEVPNPASHELENDEENENLAVSVEAVGFAKTSQSWCATGGVDGILKIWDLEKCQCRQICAQEGKDGITKLQWLEHFPIVVTASIAGVVRLWDARNGQLLVTFTGGSSATINDLQILTRSNDDVVILTASDDQKVRVFKVHVPDLLVIS
jgi:ribosome assembly protein SQT1